MPHQTDLPSKTRSDSDKPKRQMADLGAFGGRIKWARMRRELTQTELGKLVGKTRGTIAQYESGDIRPPVNEVEQLARELDVSPEFLAFGRHGVRTATEEALKLVGLQEVEVVNGAERQMGTYAVPDSMAKEFGIDCEGAKVFKIQHEAREFGYSPGDRLIVNPADAFEPAHAVYLLRADPGIAVVRLLPKLTKIEEIELLGGNGERYTIVASDVEILGAVVGAIQRF